MTEDEAKTKWCPFVRVCIGPETQTWQGVILTNRGKAPADDEDCTCIGSDCMAWRATDNEIKENPDGPIEDGRAMRSSDYVSAGYCGLAK